MKKFLKAVLIIILCITISFALLVCHGQYTIWKYMTPYRHIVDLRMAEKDVLRTEGKPAAIINDDAAFEKWMHDRPPHGRLADRLGKKIYVFRADPFNDGEGMVVYIVFDKDGIAKKAILGG
ncbi:MAG: hypothetical protein ACYC0V_20110 [Armatimonadota bacterium]